jgi:hypothetical protein
MLTSFKWIGFAFIFFCQINTTAQTISYTPYSVYGIGQLKERTSAYNRMMSGTGIGIRDNLNLNNRNPASYNAIQGPTQITEIGFYLEENKLTSSNLTTSHTNGSINPFNLWFRFSKKAAGTVGLAPFSVIDYNVIGSKNFNGDDVKIQYNGQGGLSQLYFGNAFQLTKNLSFGFNAAYIFGNADKEETILSGEAAGISLENKTTINRATFDVGVQYTIPLQNERYLIWGATFANKLRLNTSRTIRVYETNGEDSLYVDEASVDDFVLPNTIGGGLAFQSTRHTIAFDAEFKEWENAKLDEGLDLQNTRRYSLGYQYKGNPKSLKYTGLISLSSGVYFQNHYLKLNNTNFKEWGFTLGAGFPMINNRGSINLSYNYNISGTTANRLIKQQAQVFVVDIIFRDLWGIRQKFD